MQYWLMKSEPDVFGIDDLAKQPKKTEHWDGVRNYQARNMMRDEMKKGDLVFFYHSNCKEPGIVGLAEVVKEGYPDFTAFDPKAKYYDAKSDPNKPRWYMVDIKLVKDAASLTIDGHVFPAVVEKVDKMANTVQLKVKTDAGASEEWSLHQMWNDNGSDFKLTLRRNGSSETLTPISRS